MVRVVVYVRGGNVQGIIADAPGVEVMVVDYDNEEFDRKGERSFQAPRIEPTLVKRTIGRTEAQDL